MPSLDELRSQLRALDQSILELIAKRQALATEIGRIKASAGKATRDFTQEKEVVNRARGLAERIGLDADLAESIATMLIRGSLTVQEQDRVQARGEGGGRRVLIIGGAGKMGGWFARFLSSQGFAVEIADPAGAVEGFPHSPDWKTSKLDQEIIVVAAPLRTSAEILGELADRKPRGIVFDIGSLKSPLRAGLQKLRDAGVKVTSMHPMFGPDTELLSGRHIVFVELGSPEATKTARELFASTMAVQVEMDLDSHDRLVAYILGLSHALNIAFAAALSESGEDAERLMQLSSTTFDSQLDVARRVASENPHLYFEIQALNSYGAGALEGLLDAVRRISEAVRAGDEAAFVAMMERGHSYLASGTPPR
jgi:chorismate mutase/prephenate dehydrogenase